MGGVATEILHSAVQDRIATGEVRIVVDLEQVPWLNSSGIGTLMGCRTECSEAGGGLVLANANEKIRQLLETLNLSELLVCYETVEEAT
jgi:anti-sigma B factor antagonist